MLLRLAYRFATEVSGRLLWKAGYLWAYKGMKAVGAYRRRLERGELFPPFLFLALTNACNLRCHGCWINSQGRPQSLSEEDIDRIVRAGKRQEGYFYWLLGGEPMLYPRWWEIPLRHADCYFQIITNGMFLTDENVERIRRAGNVTPLVSIDGLEPNNDQRRGQGVFEAAMEGIRRLPEEQDPLRRGDHGHRPEHGRSAQRRLRPVLHPARGDVSVVLRVPAGRAPILRRSLPWPGGR